MQFLPAPTELQAALDQLREAGLLFCRGIAPHASYLFKHALVQDAAYSTLLRGRRQELHGRVAAALEEHFADLVERQPELLAHHLTAAGDAERAVDQWLKAGRYAAARYTYLEAIAHLERGLGVLHAVPEGPNRDGSEIQLQLALGLCLIPAKGALAANLPYTRAHELADRSGQPQQQFEALYGVWLSTNVSGGVTAARPLSERLLRMAERHGDDGLRLQARHSGWSTLWAAGNPARTRQHADAGRLLYDPEKHASHRLVYGGHDPGACAGHTGAQVEWLLGYPEKALASIADSLALAERLAHPFTLSLSLTFSSVLHLNRREPQQALRQLEAAEVLAEEQRLSLTLQPQFLRGAALTRCRRRSHRPHPRGRHEVDPAPTHSSFALWFGVPSRRFGAARRSGGGKGRTTGRIGYSGRYRPASLGCGVAPSYRDRAAHRK